MSDSNRNREELEDADLDRALRAAGRRAQPPEEVTQAVRAAVRAEWQAAVDVQRARRLRWAAVATAAGVSAAALGVWMTHPSLQNETATVASVARVTGEVTSDKGFWSSSRAVSEQQILHAGDELTTGRTGRVALSFPNRMSVRLDRDTTIELADAQTVVVHAGAVYVDAQPQPQSEPRLRLDTPAGSVYHIGTQYEVRLIGSGVRVRVREGEVELAARNPASPPQRGKTGEQLTVSAGGRLERAVIPTYGAAWDWVHATAPAFDIDGRELSEFLAWVARELGCEIVFSTPESKAEAARVTLSGSVAGLPPDEALAAVLSTTRLQSSRRDGQLVIDLDQKTL
jgi:ferric-dicitrate binding protein FerR (iron transport regulator)